MYYQAQKLEANSRVFKPDNARVFWASKSLIYNIDRFILVRLTFRSGVILVLRKMDVKFSCFFIRYKDTY